MESDNPNTVGKKESPNLLERFEKVEKILQDQNDRLNKHEERLQDYDKRFEDLNSDQRLRDPGPLDQLIMDHNQRLAEYDQRLLELHREKMSLHASDLEKFGELASSNRKIHTMHGADIKTDFLVLKFLELEGKWVRMVLALDGFKTRYGISRDDYYKLRIHDAPYEIVFAFNTRSDMGYLHAYQSSAHKSTTLAGMCDEIITEWKEHISAPGERDYPRAVIEAKVEQIQLLL
ncbi:hypothetical protein UA08_05867 [Talaromyces atroroseus]|uniref:Uncharacterized protein n=1 Tax=Talaromyces atroroseus TaxID=1441469 RepID=A0A225AP84_TALAT|nr:hypothetical protein UA08_05867 [Talaromyces atroroseus]OKL59098.1 hypothetical protein UA08_05867 [Talaromyces atroroseus]